MSFIDVQFPTSISYGCIGGPLFKNTSIAMLSGRVKKNQDWAYPRREYDAASGLSTTDDLEDLLAFFHITNGGAHKFPWKDFLDYKSGYVDDSVTASDQTIGTGDGSTAAFQLIKTYSFSGYVSSSRKILLPVTSSVVVAVDGAATTAFTLSARGESGGLITFDVSTWSIVAVSESENWVAVTGDKTGTITDGDDIEITGSTGNDGVYTVGSTVYDAGNGHTEIHVDSTGDITDATVDGSVKYGQPNDGSTITAGFLFDVLCYFDTDKLDLNFSEYRAGQAEIPVIEDKRGDD